MRFITIACSLLYAFLEVLMLEFFVTNLPICYMVLENKTPCIKYNVCYLLQTVSV